MITDWHELSSYCQDSYPRNGVICWIAMVDGDTVQKAYFEDGAFYLPDEDDEVEASDILFWQDIYNVTPEHPYKTMGIIPPSGDVLLKHIAHLLGQTACTLLLDGKDGKKYSCGAGDIGKLLTLSGHTSDGEEKKLGDMKVADIKTHISRWEDPDGWQYGDDLLLASELIITLE